MVGFSELPTLSASSYATSSNTAVVSSTSVLNLDELQAFSQNSGPLGAAGAHSIPH